MYKFIPMCLLRGICLPVVVAVGAIVATIAYVTAKQAETDK
jgi:hypothetical protein